VKIRFSYVNLAIFQHLDFKTASKVVGDLMDMNYSQSWNLCHKLATRKEVADLKFR